MRKKKTKKLPGLVVHSTCDRSRAFFFSTDDR